MYTPLISFIIPDFNVEKYLQKCVDSILSQTYQNIEVILVDDGSPDKCPQICDEYTVKDGRVKVIHKSNGGLSDARNAGLLFSNGEYVVFLDGDDFWMEINNLQNLVDILRIQKYDFIGFNCSYYYPTSNTYEKWIALDDRLPTNCDKLNYIISLVRSGTFPMSACLKIIRRAFLCENQISFQKGIYCEDILWFLELLEKAESLKFINLYVYAYRKEVSTSITASFSEKKYNDLLYILKRGVNMIQQYDWPEEVRYSLLSFMAYEYCTLLGFLGFFPQKQKRVIKSNLYEYEWLLRYDLNPKVSRVVRYRKYLGRNLTNFLLYKYIKTVM